MSGRSKIEWTDRVWRPSPDRPERLDMPLHWRKPGRVFVNSMSDLFHPDVPDRWGVLLILRECLMMLPEDEKLLKLADAYKAKQWIYAEGDRRELENEKRISKLANAVPHLLKRIEALKDKLREIGGAVPPDGEGCVECWMRELALEALTADETAAKEMGE